MPIPTEGFDHVVIEQGSIDPNKSNSHHLVRIKKGETAIYLPVNNDE